MFRKTNVKNKNTLKKTFLIIILSCVRERLLSIRETAGSKPQLVSIVLWNLCVNFHTTGFSVKKSNERKPAYVRKQIQWRM